MIIIQPTHEDDTPPNETIPRLKKSELAKPIEDEQESQSENFTCQKKPPMTELQTASLSSDMLHHQKVSRKRAAENYFAFIQEVITNDKCPEFNGYNTKLCREQGHSLAPKTKVVYLPLIDKPPAHAATMMTAMVKSQSRYQRLRTRGSQSSRLTSNYTVLHCMFSGRIKPSLITFT